MPRIKKATDANGSVFYPISISKAIWDTDSNQRLSQTLSNKADKVSNATANNFAALDANGNLIDSGKSHSSYSGKADKVSGATNNNLAALNSNGNLKDAGVSVADLQEDNKNALNQAVMLMLANFAGMPLKLNNAEWKYVYTDNSDHVLFGKKQDNSWSWGDDTDDLLDDVLDLYAADDTLFSNIYRLSVALSLARMSGTLSEIQNPEWKWVVTDSQDKVLMGIKTDNSWYLGCTINELVDCVLATYTLGGATNGTFANKPTSPSTGDMYFCTDLGTNGKPIWYNGTNWVDATGTIVTSV